MSYYTWVKCPICGKKKKTGANSNFRCCSTTWSISENKIAEGIGRSSNREVVTAENNSSRPDESEEMVNVVDESEEMVDVVDESEKPAGGDTVKVIDDDRNNEKRTEGTSEKGGRIQPAEERPGRNGEEPGDGKQSSGEEK